MQQIFFSGTLTLFRNSVSYVESIRVLRSICVIFKHECENFYNLNIRKWAEISTFLKLAHLPTINKIITKLSIKNGYDVISKLSNGVEKPYEQRYLKKSTANTATLLFNVIEGKLLSNRTANHLRDAVSGMAGSTRNSFCFQLFSWIALLIHIKITARCELWEDMEKGEELPSS